MTLNIVVLAAGEGKRMNSRLPKVLHRLAGRPLLEHVLATARSLQPARLCVVYGHGGEQVRAAIKGEDIIWVEQIPQRGTGDALKRALPELDPAADTLVLYGDVPLISAKSLQGLIEGQRGSVKLLTATMSDPRGYGRIVRDSDGAIQAIVEDKDATPAQHRIDEVNTGIMLLPGGRLAAWLDGLSDHNEQKEYYLTDVVALSLKDCVQVESASALDPAETAGVNSQEQLAQLERVYQASVALNLLRAGVSLADAARIDVRGSLRCGRDVRIDVGCVFEGDVELADDCEVGAHCVIRDTTVGAGTRIAPFSMIDGATIGRSAQIGPYARVRPGTTFADDVHIGNFVEVKASLIGNQSKANHLSYIGDASIGSNVNIGAGTITCNYDGVAKHRTVIEDEAFIGSNTELVAPVIVGRGATIGAGSTITENAPAAALTLSRNKQTSNASWQRPRKGDLKPK